MILQSRVLRVLYDRMKDVYSIQYVYLAAESLSPLARLLRWSAGLLLFRGGEWTRFLPARVDRSDLHLMIYL